MITLNARSGIYGHTGRFKFNFGVLARNAFLIEVGKVDELLGKLRMRIGRAKEEIIDPVEDMDRQYTPVYSRYDKKADPGSLLRIEGGFKSYRNPISEHRAYLP